MASGPSHPRMLKYEKKARRNGFQIILGIDEAGRGPLAGPVVAAAVALKTYRFDCTICDSKKITAPQRTRSFLEIYEKADVGVGIINEKVIDDQNILKATFLAMSQAVANLMARLSPAVKDSPDWQDKVLLLVDGNRFETELPYAYETIIRGDDTSLSIASASIVAKVIRDRILMTYDRIFPEYGFRFHKGYPTDLHKKAIERFGPSPIQRKTFHCV